MKTIRLFGDLERFKPEWNLEVKTVSEAIRAIEANRNGFTQAIDSGDYALALINKHDIKLSRGVTDADLLAPWSDEELWVIPRVGGEFPALIIAPLMAMGATAATAMAVSSFVMSTILSMAISMVVSLISNTSSGTSVAETEPFESKPSYLSNGVINTTRQGHRIPILYGGPMLVGSMNLSVDIHVKDIPV